MMSLIQKLFFSENYLDASPDTSRYYYAFQFPKKSVTVALVEEMEEGEENILEQLFGLVDSIQVPKKSFKEPMQKSGVVLEAEDYHWFMQKLSGLKSLPKGFEDDFIYSRLKKNYFSISKLPEQLHSELAKDIFRYFFTQNLISFSMLHAVFQSFEARLSFSDLVSQRVYQSFLEEAEVFDQKIENPRQWEILSVFVNTYHYHRYLIENKVFESLNLLLDEVEKSGVERFFSDQSLSLIVRNHVPLEKLPRFLSQNSDQTLARAFDRLDWENLKLHVSKRTYTRVLEDIVTFYESQNAHKHRLTVLKTIIHFILSDSPPFFMLNRAHELKSRLNLVFDAMGPLKSAIFFTHYEDFRKDLLPFLTPLRKGVITQFMAGKIKKRGAVNEQEVEEARKHFQYCIYAMLIFPDVSKFLI